MKGERYRGERLRNGRREERSEVLMKKTWKNVLEETSYITFSFTDLIMNLLSRTLKSRSSVSSTSDCVDPYVHLRQKGY